MFLDAFPLLTSLTLRDVLSLDLEFGQYPALQKMKVISQMYDIDEDGGDNLTPAFFEAFPNLTEVSVASMQFFVNKATMEAILESKIQKIDLAIVVQREEESEIEQLIEDIKAKMEANFKITIVN